MTAPAPIASTLPTASPHAARPAATHGPDAGAGFADALREAANSAPVAAPGARHQSSRSAQLKPEQAFESFVLRSFIEEMLPKENTAVFGGGTAGNIWRSMLAERIADEMAASGGIGIADTIKGSHKAPTGD